MRERNAIGLQLVPEPAMLPSEDHIVVEEFLSEMTHRHAHEMRVLTQRIHSLTEQVTGLQNMVDELSLENEILHTQLLQTGAT